MHFNVFHRYSRRTIREVGGQASLCEELLLALNVQFLPGTEVCCVFLTTQEGAVVTAAATRCRPNAGRLRTLQNIEIKRSFIEETWHRRHKRPKDVLTVRLWKTVWEGGGEECLASPRT